MVKDKIVSMLTDIYDAMGEEINGLEHSRFLNLLMDALTRANKKFGGDLKAMYYGRVIAVILIYLGKDYVVKNNILENMEDQVTHPFRDHMVKDLKSHPDTYKFFEYVLLNLSNYSRELHNKNIERANVYIIEIATLSYCMLFNSKDKLMDKDPSEIILHVLRLIYDVKSLN